MPEGHTVHRVARLFESVFVDRRLHASSPQGRFSSGAATITNRKLVSVQAVGKQLFLGFDNDLVVRVHLGIYGAWDVMSNHDDPEVSEAVTSLGAPRSRYRRFGESEGDRDAPDIFPPEPVGQVRLRLLTEDVVADLRGPTVCEVLTPEEALVIHQRLGPDPLVDDDLIGEEIFASRLLATKRPIGAVLMDQSVVSGIGNVYRAEILFRHRLDPYRPAAFHERDTAGKIWKDWSALLADGVDSGVMVTRSDLSAAEKKKALRSPALRHYVYKRDGKPCLVCGTAVVMGIMVARKLYLCPQCQSPSHS
jgi:endonuclease VIII